MDMVTAMAMATKNLRKVMANRKYLIWMLAVMSCPGIVSAQSSPDGEGEPTTSRRAWTVEPRVSLTETYSDNVNLASADRRSDTYTEIVPGVRLTTNSARLRFSLDYQAKRVIYADETSADETQQSLSALGRLELLDDAFFVDFSGNISQQSISALGQQGGSSSAINGNQTETSTYRVSPYLAGLVGGYAQYEVRYGVTSSRSDDNRASDSLNQEWSAFLGGNTPLAKLSWRANALSQYVRYGNQQASHADVVNARLIYQPDIEYRLWISGGREGNDYASLDKTWHSTSGGGLEWVPGPRSKVAVSRERRFFGDADSVELSHRTAKTALKYSQGKSISVVPNQAVTVGLGTIYDLMYSQLASQFPDPNERAAAVNMFLQLTGIPANTKLTSGFLTNRVSIQKNRNLSFVLLGGRNSITLSGSRSESEALLPGVFGDDFDNFSRVLQRGASILWAHQLSPLSSLNASLSRQVSSGEGVNAATTKYRYAQIGFQTSLGKGTGLGVSYRRSESEGAAGVYIENAATGTLTHKF